jgi:RHH-type rel operon transcriptional repressor/antitoxin RelB
MLIYELRCQLIAIELEPKLEQSVRHTASVLDMTLSELIHESLSEYLGKLSKPSPWELGKNYFGKYSSGQGNLAANRKQLLKSKMRAKRQ